MYRTKTNRKWKYLIAIPVLVFVLLFVNACASLNKSKENLQQVQNNEQVPTNTDEMPRFPGCENKSTLEDKYNCSSQKMYKYIYRYLVYPHAAKKNKIQGKVVARFVVDSVGNMKDIEILKDIGGGCGGEVVKVLKRMSHRSEKWIPAKQNGKKVSVHYTIPVIFRLTR